MSHMAIWAVHQFTQNLSCMQPQRIKYPLKRWGIALKQACVARTETTYSWRYRAIDDCNIVSLSCTFMTDAQATRTHSHVDVRPHKAGHLRAEAGNSALNLAGMLCPCRHRVGHGHCIFWHPRGCTCFRRGALAAVAAAMPAAADAAAKAAAARGRSSPCCVLGSRSAAAPASMAMSGAARVQDGASKQGGQRGAPKVCQQRGVRQPQLHLELLRRRPPAESPVKHETRNLLRCAYFPG